jgi:hypothetical protein
VARPVVRPDSAIAWWKALEGCAGRTGDLAAVKWLTVPGYSVVIGGEGFDGYWLKDLNAVVFGEEQFAAANRRGFIIRHELLHALLQTGAHPTEFFGRKCRQLVVREP